MSALSDLDNVQLVVVDEGGTPPLPPITAPTSDDTDGFTDEEVYQILTGQATVTASGSITPVEASPGTEHPAALVSATVENEAIDDDSDEEEDLGGPNTGGMIALVPSLADRQRLALAGYEADTELHLTLLYLGLAADFTDNQQFAIRDAMEDLISNQTAITANVFGAAMWNPDGDSPAIVLNVGGAILKDVHHAVCEAVDELWGTMLPEQHSPWVPHVCLAYTSDMTVLNQAIRLTGPITFDALRVAFAGVVTDFPLYASTIVADASTGDDMTAPTTTADPAATGDAGLPAPPAGLDISNLGPMGWYGILTVEGPESGDGRVFSANSLDLTMSDTDFGHPNLMWQKSTEPGHDGAVMVGNIQQMLRDGENIWGAGQFADTPDGQEAWRLNQSGFLTGVSVDVDSIKDADVELVFPDSDGEDDEMGFEMLFAMPEQTIFHAGRIRAATLCYIPAFTQAKIYPVQTSTELEAEAGDDY